MEPTGTPSRVLVGRRRRRTRLLFGVGAVAVAVAVVVSLFALGVGPFARAGPGPAVSFSDARSDAVDAATSGLGGSWVADGAVALDVRVLTSVPANLSGALGVGCNLTALAPGSLPSQFLVPAYGGSFGSGLSPFWAVVLTNPTSHEVILVDVVDRVATPLATITGTSCLSSGPISQPLPGTTVNSPQVAGLAWDAAGEAFVADDPSLTVLVLAALGGGFSVGGESFGGVWGVAYAPCDPFLGGSVSEKSDVAALNLTTGGLIAFYSNLAVDCPV